MPGTIRFQFRSPAVEVAAARYRDRQRVSRRVGGRDQVGARLADVVGVAAFERRVLGVRKLLVVAVGLVGGGEHDLLHRRVVPAGLEQGPGARDVRLERRDRAAVRDSHDRLSGEVKDGVHLVFGDGALEQRLVADVAPHHADAVDQVVADQLGLRHPVAHQANDVRLGREQPPDEPGAHEAGAARHEHGPVAPERLVYQTFHGAPPESHSSSSTRLSRRVSMHCQKSPCRKAASCRSSARRSSASASRLALSPSR